MPKIVSILINTLLVFPNMLFAQSNLIASIANISADSNTVYYNGAINADNVKKVLILIESGKYQTLHINSRGGEIISAMDFGISVFNNKLDVTVTGLCNSSCANYIFPAGRRKKIEVGAFVMWHGDARQKSFLLDQTYLERKALNNSHNMSENEWARLKYSQASIKKQDSFYDLLSIDGQIARLGHELNKPIGLWALSAERMNVFNIKNIDAPNDYGTTAYCQKWLPKHYASPTATCLELTVEYLNNWRMNRFEITN